MASLRQIKNRIRSTKNIGQMTKAMEAVSAVKMRKSQSVAFAARPYALAALHILKELSGRAVDINELSPLLGRRNGKHLLVVITSDKGLAGAFSSNVIRRTEQYIRTLQAETSIIAVGKKGRDYFKRKKQLNAEFVGSGDFGTLEEIRPLSQYIQKTFTSGGFADVTLIYMNFVSALRQEPTIRTLLPLEEKTLESIVNDIIPLSGRYANLPKALTEIPKNKEAALVIEPNPDTLLNKLLPKLVETEILHAILEANASEHASRMMAMKSASDNASELARHLTITFNKARQAAITKELIEITAGKEALAH